MKAAQIKNNIVINIIEVDSFDVFPNLVDPQNCQIGDSWDGVVFTPIASPGIVPKAITMKQARLTLYAHNLLASVDSLIDQFPETAKIEWQYSDIVERNNPIVKALVPLMGMTDTQIDALFIEAKDIK